MGGIFDLERIQHWRSSSSCTEILPSEKGVPVYLNTGTPKIFRTCDSEASHESSLDGFEEDADSFQSFSVTSWVLRFYYYPIWRTKTNYPSLNSPCRHWNYLCRGYKQGRMLENSLHSTRGDFYFLDTGPSYTSFHLGEGRWAVDDV